MKRRTNEVKKVDRIRTCKSVVASRRLTARVLSIAATTACTVGVSCPATLAHVGSSLLPDARVWEQVSPVDKNHSDIDQGLSMASVGGDRLVLHSTGGFAGAPTTQESGTYYLAERGTTGWATKSIVPPGGQFLPNGYNIFDSDLTRGALMWPDDNVELGPYDPNAKEGYNLYMYDDGAGSFTLLNGDRFSISGGSFSGGPLGAALWGSSDLSHVAIETHSPLTADAPSHNFECDGQQSPSDYYVCAYEWDNGALRLASVLPNGKPATGAPGTAYTTEQCGYEHAMSNDGSRLFFTSPSNAAASNSTVDQLYARENGSATTLISGSERTVPGGLAGQLVDFQSAEAAHGDRVLFTTSNSLLDSDTNETNDLYLYDYAKPAGERLTLISEDRDPNAPEGAAVDGGPITYNPCGGVMGTSEDLRRVYFVTNNQIVPGEPETEGAKLYLWNDTGVTPTVTFIATVSTTQGKGDPWQGASAWQGSLMRPGGGGEDGVATRSARVSADGRYLVFISNARLTSFDNEGRKEIYRYDAVAKSLDCASCSADAAPAEGSLRFEDEPSFTFSGPIYNHLARNVSDNGQVFFETTRGLLPQDSNGLMDVYEYEDGRLSLISSGEGASNSYFLDASQSGSDVFFTTTDQLVGWDRDENADAYDARVDGGLPEPPLPPPACEGDSCLPAPVTPIDSTPSSFVFEAPSAVAAPVPHPSPLHCAAGKVAKGRKCVKKQAVRKAKRGHEKKRARRSRKAVRRHG